MFQTCAGHSRAMQLKNWKDIKKKIEVNIEYDTIPCYHGKIS